MNLALVPVIFILASLSLSDIPGCKVYDETNRSCVECYSTYYMKEVQKNFTHTICLECQTPCYACNSSTICTSCVKTYFMKEKGVCESCLAAIEGCLLCDNKQTCTTCYGDYYPSSDICKSCGDGCGECSGPNNCSYCNYGYSSDHGYCVREAGSIARMLGLWGIILAPVGLFLLGWICFCLRIGYCKREEVDDGSDDEDKAEEAKIINQETGN